MSYYLFDHPNPNGPFYHRNRGTCKHGHQTPHLIVIHTAENKADTVPADDGAENVAKYASHTDRAVSWHSTVDSDSIIAMLPDDAVAFHARNYNTCSLGVEMAVQADKWASYSYEYRTAVIDNAARQAARWALAYGIPIRRISRAAADRGEAGLIAHADLDPDRRTDPGRSFPWYYLLTRTEEFAGAAPAPTPEPPATVQYPIIDQPHITVSQGRQWLIDKGAHQRMIDLVHVWFQECAALGVEPSIAIAQAAHETGYGKYTGVVPPEFNNWAGIKTRMGGSNSDPEAHARFRTAQEGIRAQVEHLYLYAVGPVSNPIDPRHFPYLGGRAPSLLSPGFTWAGVGYGSRIVPKVEGLRATVVDAPVVPPLTDEEILAIRELLAR